MKIGDLMDSPDAQVIYNWKQRIESISGLTCIHLNEVFKQESFTLKELIAAKEEDRQYFKGLILDIEPLL